ncbi:hypothetical protein BGZ60DRAFT_5415 [Tricladium varicosporioides]|nr:hypothetical protein BGZ60DRAFT_5415 [Hymenoscyphus varicosporioides]
MSLARRCKSCIKARRKCDKVLPRCKRCVQKGLGCTYQNEPSGPMCQSLRKMDSVDSNGSANFRIPSMTSVVPAQSHTQWENPMDIAIHMDESMHMTAAVNMNLPRQLDTPPVVMSMDLATVSYMRQYLMSVPGEFVATGGTTFLHSRMYPEGLPPLLQAVFSLSSMHIQLTSSHQPLISYVILNTVGELLHTTNSIHSFESILEFVQALILLQIITLFFPCTHILRQQAEARLPLLRSWTYRLYQSAPSSLPATMSRYQAWIFAESVRRTIHVSHMIQGIYSMVTKGQYTLTLFVEALPVNRSSFLWDIKPTEYGMRSVQEERDVLACIPKIDLISYRELVDKWDQGETTHIGRMEELLLIACKGLPDVSRKLRMRWNQDDMDYFR